MKALGSYFKIALPSTAFLCFEWIGFQLIITESGYLAHYETGANALLISIETTFYTINGGF